MLQPTLVRETILLVYATAAPPRCLYIPVWCIVVLRHFVCLFNIGGAWRDVSLSLSFECGLVFGVLCPPFEASLLLLFCRFSLLLAFVFTANNGNTRSLNSLSLGPCRYLLEPTGDLIGRRGLAAETDVSLCSAPDDTLLITGCHILSARWTTR